MKQYAELTMNAAMMGRHAWWLPRWLDRILPHIDIEGSEHIARLTATTVPTR